MKKLLTLTFVLSLAGCGLLPQKDLPIGEAVIIGTLAYIDNDPEKAQDVVDFVAISKEMQKEDGSLDSVAINRLLQESLDYSQLEDYQVFAIKALLVRIVGELNAREIDPKTKVDVQELLDVAEQTARFYLEQYL